MTVLLLQWTHLIIVLLVSGGLKSRARPGLKQSPSTMMHCSTLLFMAMHSSALWADAQGHAPCGPRPGSAPAVSSWSPRLNMGKMPAFSIRNYESENLMCLTGRSNEIFSSQKLLQRGLLQTRNSMKNLSKRIEE
jgi:hypothetical protein